MFLSLTCDVTKCELLCGSKHYSENDNIKYVIGDFVSTLCIRVNSKTSHLRSISRCFVVYEQLKVQAARNNLRNVPENHGGKSEKSEGPLFRRLALESEA